MKPRFLWEILVPTSYNDGKPVRTRHHKEWDKRVRKISGGLTILSPVKGQWICRDSNMLYSERMIPVRIYCTEKQIHNIAKFTINHYRQIAVMAYSISDKVFLIKNDSI